jgi:hypothetical protein
LQLAQLVAAHELRPHDTSDNHDHSATDHPY